MPEDLKLSQIGSSQLPTPFRGLHSPGVRKHCQIIFACYFRKSSIASGKHVARTADQSAAQAGEKVGWKKVKQNGRLFDSNQSSAFLFDFVT